MPHATNWGLNPSLSQLRLANFKRSDIKRARTGSPNLAVRTNRGPNCLDKVRSRDYKVESTEIGKKAWMFTKLQLGRARKRINAT